MGIFNSLVVNLSGNHKGFMLCWGSNMGSYFVFGGSSMRCSLMLGGGSVGGIMTLLSWNLNVSYTGVLNSRLVSVFSLFGHLNVAGSRLVDRLLDVTRLLDVAGLLVHGLLVARGLLDVTRLLLDVAWLLIDGLLVAGGLLVARLSVSGLLNDVTC
jgi:hypothetical protein